MQWCREKDRVQSHEMFASGDIDGVRREERRRLRDANVLRDRAEGRAKGLYGVFRVEHIEMQKPFGPSKAA